MGKFIIRLEQCNLWGRIGVSEQERTVGNEFTVDICIKIDSTKFIQEDLSTTISYVGIYETVKETFAKSWKLLESVARHIAETIRNNYPTIEKINVKITKLAVPISGISGMSSVEYEE